MSTVLSLLAAYHCVFCHGCFHHSFKTNLKRNDPELAPTLLSTLGKTCSGNRLNYPIFLLLEHTTLQLNLCNILKCYINGKYSRILLIFFKGITICSVLTAHGIFGMLFFGHKKTIHFYDCSNFFLIILSWNCLIPLHCCHKLAT